MNNKTNMNEKWDKISTRTKKWYMFSRVSLRINVFLMLCLLIAFELVEGDRHVNFGLFVATLFVKLILVYSIGVYSGHLEWEFLKKLANKEFLKAKDIRRNYVLVYGICMFGVNFTIACINPAFEGLSMIVVELMIYLLTGVIWGYVMSGIGGSFSKYITEK